ncbi:MAG: hypothetical protein IKI58_10830 [Oscillospiraceae bacterium]|nr:hypothetical protein [Oscillospiraceae bacterium]
MEYEQQEVRLPGENGRRPQKRPARPASQQQMKNSRQPGRSPEQRPAQGSRPAGSRPAGSRPAGSRPAGAGTKPAGTRQAPAGTQRPAQGTRPAGTRQAPADAQRPTGNRPAGNRQAPAGTQRPSGTRFASGNRPAGTGAKPAGNRQTPPGSRFAESRASAGARANGSPQRRSPAGSAARAHTGTRAAADHTAEAQTGSKKHISYWRLGMTIYIVLFLIFIAFILRWIWVLCREYEDSQPKYTIENYITQLNESDPAAKEAFYQDLLKEKINELPLSQYETTDSIYNTLEISQPEDYTFSWRKNSKEFTEKKPVYYLRCGETAIAQVELKRKGGTKKHDFDLWEVGEVTSLMEVASEPEYDLNVVMPAGSTLTVNGITVDQSIITPCDSPLKLDDAALKYAEQPTAQQCKITGLYAAPVIEAKDASGRILTQKDDPKSTAKHLSVTYEPAYEESISEEFMQRATDLTGAYINYVINKDEAQTKNFNALSKLLVYKSNCYNTLSNPTLMFELHWNNPYTARKDGPTTVYHLQMYSDNCCTCEVDYEYQLTKKVINDYAGTLKWTLVKSEDGKWFATDFVTVKSSEGTHTVSN